MRIKRLCLTAALACASVYAHSTTLPAPIWHTMTLSDGSSKELRLMGWEDLFWYQDHEGFLYIQGDDLEWYFAEYDSSQEQGVMSSTGILATSDSIPPQQSNIDKVNIKPTYQSQSSHQPRANTKSKLTPHAQGRSLSTAASSGSDVTNQPLLVVQVGFTDVKIENDFTNTIFGQNQQSVQDYFLKNSYGKYKVVPAKESQGTANDGIIDVELNIAHPNCHSKTDSSCQSKLNNVFTSAYAALDSNFDLSQYDDDNNGSIEPSELSVMFVFAGNDKSSGTNKTPTIWPHKYAHSTVTIDGKRISSYCLFADYQHDNQSAMGVIAHELGHLMLGLPDLYSYKHDGSIGHWGLMGGGSWGRKPGDTYSGQTPVNMLAWSKEAAGFIEPRTLTNTGSIDLNTNQGESVIYLDPYLKQFGPRLYVENRRKNHYDRALKGEGLLVTAVNIDNHFNSTGPMQVQVMQADDQGLLESGRSSGDNGDVFPGSDNVTTLSDSSSPALTDVTGGRATEIELASISSDNTSASFNLTIPASADKSAWVTSFGRTYPSYQTGSNVLGFAVNVTDSDQRLVGFQFYAKPTTVAMPMFYRLLKYPYTTRFGRVIIDESREVVLGRGVAPENGGQVMLDAPFALSQGNHLIVLELENGTPEYSTQFLDAYLGDGQRKTQYYGTLADYKTHGLNNGFSRNFPFAALFEGNQTTQGVAVDDYVRTQEDTPIRLDLTANDTGLDDNEQYQIEVTQRPSLGRVAGEVYYPNKDMNGRDKFSYRLVGDKGTITNEAEVSVDILAVNDAPSFKVKSNSARYISGTDVTLSIVDLVDVDSSRLSIRWSQVKGTRLTVSGTRERALRFRLPEDTAAGSRFEFVAQVTDNLGATSQQRFQFTTKSKLRTPIQNNVKVAYEGNIKVAPNLDSRLVRIELLSDPDHGVAKIVGQSIVYTAPSKRSMSIYDQVSYKAWLEDGSEVIGSYEIEVVATSGGSDLSSQPTVTDESSGGGISILFITALMLLVRVRKN